MKLLVVKTSSLGDVVHALPAVNEAVANIPELEITWVVEEGIADIPAMHPAVKTVLPIAVRRWRKSWWNNRAEIRSFVRQLRAETYDVVLDSQGLIKSAVVARLARGGERHGYDKESAREPLASRFYLERHLIPSRQHAIVRQKQLFASALGYKTGRRIEYGMPSEPSAVRQQVVLLHGTTWRSKEWPVSQWRALAERISRAGYDLVIPAGSDDERWRATRIIDGLPGRILDRLPLVDLVHELKASSGVVCVDTGLGHLAPAFDIPVVALFGATDPSLTGVKGDFTEVIVSDHLPCIPCRRRDCKYPIPGDSSSIYPPCFDQITPETVWQALKLQIGSKVTKPD